MRIRHLLAAAMLAAATSTVLISASATAAPPCKQIYGGPNETAAGVAAHGYLSCVNPDHDGQPLPVTLQKQTIGTHFWITVAEGVGEVEYLCDGYNVSNRFRIAQAPQSTLSLNCA